jgi:hypothetical protein
MRRHQFLMTPFFAPLNQAHSEFFEVQNRLFWHRVTEIGYTSSADGCPESEIGL